MKKLLIVLALVLAAPQGPIFAATTPAAAATTNVKQQIIDLLKQMITMRGGIVVPPGIFGGDPSVDKKAAPEKHVEKMITLQKDGSYVAVPKFWDCFLNNGPESGILIQMERNYGRNNPYKKLMDSFRAIYLSHGGKY